MMNAYVKKSIDNVIQIWYNVFENKVAKQEVKNGKSSI